MDEKTRTQLKYGWATAMIIAGQLFNHYGIGAREFAGYPTLGAYLTYIGFLGLIVVTVVRVRRKKKLVDERMEYVAAKSMRVTFLALIVAAFAVIVADGIKPITIPYHMFMSYLVCGLLLFHYATYRILLRKY